MKLLEKSNLEIFSSLPLSIEYCQRLGRGWCVYRNPHRESFTVSKMSDLWTDKVDRRWVIHINGD